MPFEIRFNPEPLETLNSLASGKKKDPVKHKKVAKALTFLSQDPSYPSLHTHEYHDSDKKFSDGNQKLFTSYVENNTPSAWRIVWQYGPHEGEIQVISLVYLGPHY